MLNASEKIKAKEVAQKEVLARIKTLEDAKKEYKRWIKKSIKEDRRFLSPGNIEFWNEVYKEVDNVF